MSVTELPPMAKRAARNEICLLQVQMHRNRIKDNNVVPLECKAPFTNPQNQAEISKLALSKSAFESQPHIAYNTVPKNKKST